jgi:hypothetical protein
MQSNDEKLESNVVLKLGVNFKMNEAVHRKINPGLTIVKGQQ